MVDHQNLQNAFFPMPFIPGTPFVIQAPSIYGFFQDWSIPEPVGRPGAYSVMVGTRIGDAVSNAVLQRMNGVGNFVNVAPPVYGDPVSGVTMTSYNLYVGTYQWVVTGNCSITFGQWLTKERYALAP
jgi:hypothetical protein